MKREIPAKTEIICDICEIRCHNATRKQNAELILKRDALDYSGSAVADGTLRFDLCDRCLHRVENALNDLTVEIREDKKHE